MLGRGGEVDMAALLAEAWSASTGGAGSGDAE